MYVLQALTLAAMEYKESMSNLISINLTLYHSLTQSQEKTLVLSKQINTLQAQSKSNKPTTYKPVLINNKRDNKSKMYCWNHGRTYSIYHTRPSFQYPKTGHQVGVILDNKIVVRENWYK